MHKKRIKCDARDSRTLRGRHVSMAKQGVMTSLLWRSFLLFAGVAGVVPVQALESGFPDWLGGKPDVDIDEGRCGVYEWFFDEADSQTDGMASEDDLASRRVINMANKLVEHHLTDPAESYGAEVRFLVFGEDGPLHFDFHISNAELERIMDKDCGR